MYGSNVGLSRHESSSGDCGKRHAEMTGCTGVGQIVVQMHLSRQVGNESKEQDFTGSVDSSLVISGRDVGLSSVSGSMSLGMMTGMAAAAVNVWILATLSTKNLALTDLVSGRLRWWS